MSTLRPHRLTRSARSARSVRPLRSAWRPLVAIGVALGTVVSAVGLAPGAAGAQAAGADLSIAVSHAPSWPLSGDDVTFTITAANDGPATAADVVVGVSLGYSWRFDGTSAPDACGFGGETQAVICSLGAVAPGASTTVTVTAVPLMAGVFVVPGAVASDTPDPDALDRAATDTVIVRPGPSRLERAVGEVYEQVLGRVPSARETAYWSGQWETVGWDDRHRVPWAIIASPESGRRRIQAAYETLLGRPARTGDVGYWSAELTRGRSFEAFEAAVIGSPEYARRHGPSTRATLQAVFAQVLGRGATVAELDAWTGQVDRGAPIAGVVAQLQRTNEARNRVITQRVQQVLGRPPHDFDRLVWLGELGRGSTHDEQWAMLYAGDEYLNRFPYDYGFEGDGF